MSIVLICIISVLQLLNLSSSSGTLTSVYEYTNVFFYVH
jgi:hypothetical protein